METIFIGGTPDEYSLRNQLSESVKKNGGNFVCIGVRKGPDTSETYDLTSFLKRHPYLQVVKRFTEVPNWNYPDHEDNHMLQPAILQYTPTGQCK